MNGFNPLSGAILGSTVVQQTMQLEKERQVRRSQALSKDVAAEDDRLEHEVESTERVAPVNEEEAERYHQRKSREHAAAADDEKPHLDVTG